MTLRSAVWPASLLLVTFASGCGRGEVANLSAIKSMSAQVTAAAPAFAAVTSDLYQSCLRLRELNGATRLGGLSGSRPLALDQTPIEPPLPAHLGAESPDAQSSEPAATPLPAASPLPNTDPAADPRCTAREWESRTWALRDSFVTAYVGDLAKLAGASTSVTGFERTAAAFKKIGVIRGDALATLAGDAVNAIGSSVLVHERDRDILAVVRAADAAGIDKLVFDPLLASDADYLTILKLEKNADDAYFGALLTRQVEALQALRKGAGLVPDPDFPATRIGPGGAIVEPPPDPDACLKDAATDACRGQLAAFELRERIRAERAVWKAADDAFPARFTAAQAYYTAMHDIEIAHGKIAQSAPGNLAGTLEQLKPYVDQISGNVSQLVTSTSATPAAASKTPAN
jgi:hypothetical protein